MTIVPEIPETWKLLGYFLHMAAKRRHDCSALICATANDKYEAKGVWHDDPEHFFGLLKYKITNAKRLLKAMQEI